MVNKGLDFYAGLDYQVVLAPLTEEDGGGWHAEHPELPGCASDGENPEEALLNLKEARRAWLHVALKRGMTIPQPQKYNVEEYSGKFTLRVPKSMHRRFAQLAKKEGVSLNQMVLSLVSLGLGRKEGGRRGEIVIRVHSLPDQEPLRLEGDPWRDFVGGRMASYVLPRVGTH